MRLQAGLVTSQGKLTPAGTRYLATEDPDLLLDAFEHWSENGSFDAVMRLQAKLSRTRFWLGAPLLLAMTASVRGQVPPGTLPNRWRAL